MKVVAQLLSYLPGIPGLSYRVIFMERDIQEVLASQKSMLKRQDRQGAKLSEDRLHMVFARQLKQTRTLLSMRNIPALFVDYNSTLKYPEETAARVAAFLGRNLDDKKMCEAVVPSLKRQDSPPALSQDDKKVKTEDLKVT